MWILSDLSGQKPGSTLRMHLSTKPSPAALLGNTRRPPLDHTGMWPPLRSLVATVNSHLSLPRKDPSLSSMLQAASVLVFPKLG